MSRKANFPKYQMTVNGQSKFLTLCEAAIAYDSGLVPVEFGIYVLNQDYTLRDMTPRDQRKISNAADEYSASK